jgi:hypothetical protein
MKRWSVMRGFGCVLGAWIGVVVVKDGVNK